MSTTHTHHPHEHVPFTRDTVVLPQLAHMHSPAQSNRRGGVHLVTLHRPVGSYQGSISTMMEDRGEDSAAGHIILAPGGREATQLVDWEQKAWACRLFNSASDNLEIADGIWLGKFTEGQFHSNDPDGWLVAARIAAFRCAERKIPATWTRDPLNRAGLVRHYDLGIAGGGHTDPTTDPGIWLAFVDDVKYQVKRGKFRKEWGN